MCLDEFFSIRIVSHNQRDLWEYYNVFTFRMQLPFRSPIYLELSFQTHALLLSIDISDS